LKPAQTERHLAAILAADVAGYSRLMGVDEGGTLTRLKDHRSTVWDPALARHRGRVANTAGDSILAEFSSVTEAVTCALTVQKGMLARNAKVAPDQRIEFRIGINLGEILTDGQDIFGEGVNVAARLEGIADRGGICISRQVLDQIEGKLDLSYRELGRQNLKNISRPVEVYAIRLDDVAVPGSNALAAANLKQEIRYCKAPDGVRLAYAMVGQGAPLLKSAHWLGHLEYDWEFPILRPFLLGLAKGHTLVRYDARGNGLSDWDVRETSLDAWVTDMEAVADAASLGRFPILGFSQGCAVAIAYAPFLSVMALDCVVEEVRASLPAALVDPLGSHDAEASWGVTGGPMERSAKVLRFCTIAARWNSSRAPDSPRSRMRSNPWWILR
jgi:class 3 adenylate cyclase